MIGVYFSGTGNTKYCVEKYLLDYEGKAEMYSIEEEEVKKSIEENTDILFAYPIQYSNIPKFVYDFICDHKLLWKGKNIYILATMGLFSGDGSGVSERLFKKYGANIIGGLHVNMPDSVADVKAVKRSLEKNRSIVNEGRLTIKEAAEKMKQGRPTKDGLSLFSHLLGLFGQRLYFYNKTKTYSDKLKINTSSCIGCGTCEKVCPMHNISMVSDKAVASNKCTMCYRCISQCPKQAITLIGDQVVMQSRIDKFL